MAAPRVYPHKSPIITVGGIRFFVTAAGQRVVRADAAKLNAWIARLLEAGNTIPAVMRIIPGCDRNRISRVRSGLTTVRHVDSISAQARIARIRELAHDGYNIAQLATQVGLSAKTCRGIVNRHQIRVHGERAIRRGQRRDSRRILERIVQDAQHLTVGVELVDFSTFTRAECIEWQYACQEARRDLDRLIAQLRRSVKHAEERSESDVRRRGPQAEHQKTCADQVDQVGASTDRATRVSGGARE